MDNKNVVPYNAYLLMFYQALVNVEYSNKSNVIKYLFKYVNKGLDRVAVGVSKETSSGEDAQRWSLVTRLTFYFPGEQNIIFKNDGDLEKIVEEEEEKCTMFLAWTEANKEFEAGQTLTAVAHDMILLGQLMGLHSNFQDACYSIGLLCDDREFFAAINEVAELISGHQLRKIFVLLLISNSVSKPDRVWNATWTLLADEILYERRKALKNQGLNMTDDELKNLCLIEIEKILNSNARSLRNYQSMPYPELSDVRFLQNKLIEEELAYDTNELTNTNLYKKQKMTDKQRLVFTEILNAVIIDSGGFYFVYGHSGCGKTFIWNGLSSTIRSRGNIVLNVTSSRIVSLLLPTGRTAHSRFSIPITITDEYTYKIKHGSLKAGLLIQSSLIIWYEARMFNKICFDALDRMLRDLMSADQHKTHQPFGDKVVVLGGDFRQILSVIPKESRHDILSLAINSSHLWSFCKVLKLHTNMRLLMSYSDQHGEILVSDELEVEIPNDLMITTVDDPLFHLEDFAYPDLLQNMSDYGYFQSRTILTPTLESVENVK
ncbi:uncharacterized protein LOC107633506 [Arachis ipaensis]|uniref:uncharacterized protein LOC107633506 n=1 Tax=Arachis ipaensis TaxID=130454 RepID=UPI0007AFD4E0|nr:uncharacterized protein LOC107633506 [Arachis ipaensis]